MGNNGLELRLVPLPQICRRFRIPDATAFLLEKTGDVQGAFNIFLEVAGVFST